MKGTSLKLRNIFVFFLNRNFLTPPASPCEFVLGNQRGRKGAITTYFPKETLQGDFALLHTQEMENLWRGQGDHSREQMAVSCTA